MWNLDDESIYFKLFSATIPHAFTWGARDLEKREAIREAVARHFPQHVPAASWWAFRILARKSRAFDVENIPKLVIDSFSGSQLVRDASKFPQLELYPDDTSDSVGLVAVAGELAPKDSTVIEVFGRRKQAA